MNYLKIPVIRTPNPLEKTHLYNLIELITPDLIRWQLIAEGGFSILHVAEGQIIYIDQAAANLS